jgi:AcrR family transcriptional regulator
MSARERLIEATAELLPRDGYSAMSPAAIQHLAGVGQGSMYHHFSGKAELARVALQRNALLLVEAAESALDGEGTPVQRVCAYLRRERDPLRGCPVGRVAQDREVIEDVQMREPIGGMFAALEQRIATVLAQDARIDAPAELAATVVAVLQGSYVLARAAGDRAPFDRAIHGATRLLQTIERGDATVSAAPGERHRRRARPDRTMTHLALQDAGEDGSEAEWGEHVSDSEQDA